MVQGRSGSLTHRYNCVFQAKSECVECTNRTRFVFGGSNILRPLDRSFASTRKFLLLDGSAEFSQVHDAEIKVTTVGISGGGVAALPLQFCRGDRKAKQQPVSGLRIPSHRVTKRVLPLRGFALSNKRTTQEVSNMMPHTRGSVLSCVPYYTRNITIIKPWCAR